MSVFDTHRSDSEHYLALKSALLPVLTSSTDNLSSQERSAPVSSSASLLIILPSCYSYIHACHVDICV